MDAVILAAGRGMRLRPFTNNLPKPLVPVAGKAPLLRLQEELPSCVNRIILVVGYLGDKIRQTIGEYSQNRPVICVVQNPLDGTGGALRQAKSAISSESFLAVNGDDIYSHQDLDYLLTVERGLLVKPQIFNSAVSACTFQDGSLASIDIKPKGYFGYINCGAYHLGHEWFSTKPVSVPGKIEEWSLPHAILQLKNSFSYKAVEATFWFPCGTREEIHLAEVALNRKG